MPLIAKPCGTNIIMVPVVQANATPTTTANEVLPGAPDPSEPVSGDAPAPADLTGWKTASGDAGRFELAWRTADGKIPRNRGFSMEVLLRRGSQPCPGANLIVGCWMPDHGHGMVRKPTVEELGDGRYAVNNMLLHMRGHWDLTFEVALGETMDTIRFKLEL